MVRSLREEVANFSMVHNQMLERSNMKVCVCMLINVLRVYVDGSKKKEYAKARFADALRCNGENPNNVESVFLPPFPSLCAIFDNVGYIRA